jgi:hypothetical protein
MEKIIFFLLLFYVFLIKNSIFAQTDSTKIDSTQKSSWTKTGSINIAFNNVQLTNWAAGGQNSLALSGVFNGKTVYETKKEKWSSELTLQLGGAKVGDGNRLFKKTDDFLIVNTQYDRKINKNWAFSGILDLRTQMLAGFEFYDDATGQERRGKLLSEMFAPAFLTASLGFTYQNKIISATISPLASRLTIVQNDSLSKAGAFGVKVGEKTLLEIGVNFNAKLDLNIMENINLKSNLILFSKYDDWIGKGIWDANWETMIVLKVNKYITTSFGTHLIYFNNTLITQRDGTSKQALQFKQVLAINVGVKF